jgi:hypothetical protein
MRLIARFLIAHLPAASGAPAINSVHRRDVATTARRVRGSGGLPLERTDSWDDNKGRANDEDRKTREESSEPMKAMTCKQLGGPCDYQHQRQAADEVIKAQDRHLKGDGRRW